MLSANLLLCFKSAPGQILGTFSYKASEADIGYPTGHWINAGLLFFVAVGSILLRLFYGRRNRKLLQQCDGEGQVRLYKY